MRLVTCLVAAACAGTATLAGARVTVDDDQALCHDTPETDICFVHVGKSGGASMQSVLRMIAIDGYVGNFVQVHSHFGLKADRRCSWSKPRRVDEGHRFSKIGGGSRMDPDGEAFHSCGATGRVLLWMRDPVGRFLSAFKAYSSAHPGECKLRAAMAQFVITHRLLNETGSDGVDIDSIVRGVAAQNGGRLGGKAWQAFLQLVPHVRESAEFYLHALKGNVTSLPIAFVGRTEAMMDDWDEFLRTTLRLIPAAVNVYTKRFPHTNEMPSRGVPRKLSKTSIELLRTYYAEDYAIIHQLARAGWLSSAYETEVRTNQTYLHYAWPFQLDRYFPLAAAALAPETLSATGGSSDSPLPPGVLDGLCRQGLLPLGGP